MPFVDYARLFGSMFTRDLSKASACAKCPPSSSPLYEAMHENFKSCKDNPKVSCPLRCKPYEETCGRLSHVADQPHELDLAKVLFLV